MYVQNPLPSMIVLSRELIQVEFGKATDTGYKDGKVIERVCNPYLQRYKVERALAAVQSSHQRAAFVMNAELGHSLQTQGSG